MNNILPTEVQGYIRHILHMIGVIIVAKGGVDSSMMEIYVGGLVNLISLVWFLGITITQKYKMRKTRENVASDS